MRRPDCGGHHPGTRRRTTRPCSLCRSCSPAAAGRRCLASGRPFSARFFAGTPASPQPCALAPCCRRRPQRAASRSSQAGNTPGRDESIPKRAPESPTKPPITGTHLTPKAVRAWPLLRRRPPRGPGHRRAATYPDAITVSLETVTGNLGAAAGTKADQELMEAAPHARESPPTCPPSDGLTLGGRRHTTTNAANGRSHHNRSWWTPTALTQRTFPQIRVFTSAC